MTKYAVNKFFGHFWQCWIVDAENEDDAWNNAERNGTLEYQSVYMEPKDLESKGYVVDLDKKEMEQPRISEEQYSIWLQEAIKKGMIVRT